MSEPSKLPPQAADLEEAVLGAAILEANGARALIEKLKPEDFFKEEHKLIFEAMLELANQGQPIDMRSIVATLRKQNKVNLAGGAYYIAELTSKVSSAASIDYHCAILKEMTIKRELILLGQQMMSQGYRDDQDAFELIDKLRKGLMQIEHSISGQHKEVHIKDVLYQQTMQLQERGKTEGAVMNGVPSGFHSIDRITQGWQKSDLIIIAGRPGMAKTSLALMLGRNSAIMFKKPVAIFSLEMSSIQLVAKVTSVETEIDLRIIRGERFTEPEWQQYTHKIGALAKAPIYIDDTPGLSVLDMRARCRRLKDMYGIELIIVDYLQLMRGERASRGNREEEISSISRTLKHIAKELDVPVIALSQLSRAVETRGGKKKPQLSDLRESGAIEQDADIVCFVWRPEYYKIEMDEDGMLYAPGYTELSFAKHRNGALGTAKLQFVGKYTGFRNLDDLPPSISNAVLNNVKPPDDTPKTAYPDTSEDTPF